MKDCSVQLELPNETWARPTVVVKTQKTPGYRYSYVRFSLTSDGRIIISDKYMSFRVAQSIGLTRPECTDHGPIVPVYLSDIREGFIQEVKKQIVNFILTHNQAEKAIQNAAKCDSVFAELAAAS